MTIFNPTEYPPDNVTIINSLQGLTAIGISGTQGVIELKEDPNGFYYISFSSYELPYTSPITLIGSLYEYNPTAGMGLGIGTPSQYVGSTYSILFQPLGSSGGISVYILNNNSNLAQNWLIQNNTINFNASNQGLNIISASITLTSGSKLGYILTSDAQGNASWTYGYTIIDTLFNYNLSFVANTLYNLLSYGLTPSGAVSGIYKLTIINPSIQSSSLGDYFQVKYPNNGLQSSNIYSDINGMLVYYFIVVQTASTGIDINFYSGNTTSGGTTFNLMLEYMNI